MSNNGTTDAIREFFKDNRGVKLTSNELASLFPDLNARAVLSAMRRLYESGYLKRQDAIPGSSRRYWKADEPRITDNWYSKSWRIDGNLHR